MSDETQDDGSFSEEEFHEMGFNAGKNDGWLGNWATPEEGDPLFGNEAYLEGYRAGWKEGSKNPKPKGQLPPPSDEE